MDRRHFIGSTALGSMVLPHNLFGSSIHRGAGIREQVHSGKNLYLVWNDIRNPEGGESDEFTNVENVINLLDNFGVPKDRILTGIGARTGVAGSTYGVPGEFGFHWPMHQAWEALVTNPSGEAPLSLGPRDPMAVSQMGVLNEDSAHRFTLSGAQRAGTVLWSFYNDETVQTILRRGYHNSFRAVDGGLPDTLYKATRRARQQPGLWGNRRWRRRLTRFMPKLSHAGTWQRFRESLHTGLVESEWIPYIREQGWAGAAIVLSGSMQNVCQFYLKEWNRLSPVDPAFEIGKGVHGPLRIRYGREVMTENRAADAQWSMTGFIKDLNFATEPSMHRWRKVTDIFGHPYHIHGFRMDGGAGGHTIFAMLGEGDLDVTLYPLTFDDQETAFLFNNDLALDPQTINQDASGFSIQAINHGQSYCRNILCEIVNLETNTRERTKIDLVRPRQRFQINFNGLVGQDSQAERLVRLDWRGNFIEGGDGKANNALVVTPQHNWHWL